MKRKLTDKINGTLGDWKGTLKMRQWKMQDKKMRDHI